MGWWGGDVKRLCGALWGCDHHAEPSSAGGKGLGCREQSPWSVFLNLACLMIIQCGVTYQVTGSRWSCDQSRGSSCLFTDRTESHGATSLHRGLTRSPRIKCSLLPWQFSQWGCLWWGEGEGGRGFRLPLVPPPLVPLRTCIQTLVCNKLCLSSCCSKKPAHGYDRALL